MRILHDGVQPLPIFKTYNTVANLTVYDSTLPTGADPAPIPEPGASALTGCGLIGLGLVRRKARGSAR